MFLLGDCSLASTKKGVKEEEECSNTTANNNVIAKGTASENKKKVGCDYDTQTRPRTTTWFFACLRFCSFWRLSLKFWGERFYGWTSRSYSEYCSKYSVDWNYSTVTRYSEYSEYIAGTYYLYWRLL